MCGSRPETPFHPPDARHHPATLTSRRPAAGTFAASARVPNAPGPAFSVIGTVARPGRRAHGVFPIAGRLAAFAYLEYAGLRRAAPLAG